METKLETKEREYQKSVCSLLAGESKEFAEEDDDG